MVGTSWARLICKHSRAFVVWAMIPLTVFNGHTVIGCGCTGHFMAEGHCHHPPLEQSTANPKTPRCPLCSSHAASTCSCCDSNRNDPATNSRGLRGHRCCC